MSIEDENDISSILIDGDIYLDSPLNLDISNEDKPIVKRLKPLLRCVVCGDNAFGIIKFLFISKKSFHCYFRIQFRCYFM